MRHSSAVHRLLTASCLPTVSGCHAFLSSRQPAEQHLAPSTMRNVWELYWAGMPWALDSLLYVLAAGSKPAWSPIAVTVNQSSVASLVMLFKRRTTGALVT